MSAMLRGSKRTSPEARMVPLLSGKAAPTACLRLASIATIGLCLTLWVRAKTVDQEQRGNAERRAIFVGLWPPMLWLIGESLRDPSDPVG
ncbi:hypothetical protein ACFU90_04015 [Streptomyces noursei]|uniref:hypothetical protein n=1 Tax=Streptomyces noursei TaxID=1971 RepID=UPI001E429DE8|nr:hypothetical protein [Streptomyces noursei]